MEYLNLILGGFLLLITVLLILLVISNLLTTFFGAPFLPTKNKDLDEILEVANLKAGQIFFELGSGDGRVVMRAVKKYQVQGVGVELNPLWFLYSIIVSKICGVKDISFKRKNFFDISFSNADVLFIFILPSIFEDLSEKIKKECKKGTLIICHGFEMKQLKKNQFKKINRDLFPTYYYKLR